MKKSVMQFQNFLLFFFVSHKINQKNLIKMGIEKNKIFNFGALGLNDLKRYNIKKNLIEKN